MNFVKRGVLPIPSPNGVIPNRCLTDATRFKKCKASTTQVHGTFPRALHFDLTWYRISWGHFELKFSSLLNNAYLYQLIILLEYSLLSMLPTRFERLFKNRLLARLCTKWPYKQVDLVCSSGQDKLVLERGKLYHATRTRIYF